MQESLQKYLRSFKNLRIDRAHGIAPHKPILLISVLQTFQNGTNNSQRIYITPELVALFKTNWSLLVTSKHDCRFALPFYHLTSDKFWKLIPKSGFENIMQLSASMRNFTSLNAAVDCAIIEDDLLLLMKDTKSNEILIRFLLDEYFPSSRDNFTNFSGGKPKLFDDIESKILKEPSEEYRHEIKKLFEQKNEEEIFLRGSIFKREIPKIYNNTCCISGMKIDAIGNVSMIDACHIVPFSISYDDTVTNGIALCPNLHRAFDRGLIAIDEKYRVIVSNTFKENESIYSIRNFEHKKINFPNIEGYYPLKENFDWHRKNIFKS
ncbi:MAG TPA: HNH endonuclease [Candidatus Kapabacteria bacterium]|nr:HNH endonuclease [Candidatus Kapabacteria bacterium]